jgi:hypothetical protein
MLVSRRVFLISLFPSTLCLRDAIAADSPVIVIQRFCDLPAPAGELDASPTMRAIIGPLPKARATMLERIKDLDGIGSRACARSVPRGRLKSLHVKNFDLIHVWNRDDPFFGKDG